MNDFIYWSAFLLTVIAATVLLTLTWLDLPTKAQRDREGRS